MKSKISLKFKENCNLQCIILQLQKYDLLEIAKIIHAKNIFVEIDNCKNNKEIAKIIQNENSDIMSGYEIVNE